VNVRVGVLAMPTVADDDTVRYAKPTMPLAPMSLGRRSTLSSAGAGEGDVLSVMLSVAEPPVVAGKPAVSERPPAIGANVALAGAAPTVTDAVVDEGYVGAPPPDGGVELLPLLQPAMNAAMRRAGNR
jgi:hypothetical protein